MGRGEIRKVQASEMRFLRSSVGVIRRDRLRNNREEVGEEPLIDFYKKWKAAYL